jgi:hypothetical protein
MRSMPTRFRDPPFRAVGDWPRDYPVSEHGAIVASPNCPYAAQEFQHGGRPRAAKGHGEAKHCASREALSNRAAPHPSRTKRIVTPAAGGRGSAVPPLVRARPAPHRHTARATQPPLHRVAASENDSRQQPGPVARLRGPQWPSAFLRVEKRSRSTAWPRRSRPRGMPTTLAPPRHGHDTRPPWHGHDTHPPWHGHDTHPPWHGHDTRAPWHDHDIRPPAPTQNLTSPTATTKHAHPARTPLPRPPPTP